MGLVCFPLHLPADIPSILTGRNPERLEQAAHEVDAQRTAAFDANDPASLQSFFQDLPTPIDH